MSWLSSLAQRAATLGGQALRGGARQGARLGISAGGSSIAEVAQREMVYQANHELPGLVLGPDEVLSLLYSGSLSDHQADDLLRYHGIRWSWADANSNNKRAWCKWVEDNRPSLEGAELIDAWLRGNIGEDHVREVLRRGGLVEANVQAYYLDQRPPADLSLLRQQWRLGNLSWNTFRDELRRQGWLKDGRYRYEIDATNPLDVTSLFALVNRGDITGERAVRHLAALGFVHDGDRDALLKLRFEIPGASDLVQFAVKEVWDQDVVREFGYDDEFPAEFQFWMDKQGMGWQQDVVTPGGVIIPGVPWPRAYWRAHWNTLAPGQAYDALHRLRGDPANPATWRVPGVRPFTSADVSRVLKIADYPSRFRQVLESLSYNVLGRIDVRRMYGARVLTRAQVQDAYQDMGYTATDAELLTRFTVIQAEQTANGPQLRGLKARVSRGYKLGTMTYDQAARRLYPAFQLDPLELDAWRARDVVTQTQQALALPGLRAYLDGIDADRETELVSTAIKAIRASFVRFDLDQQGAAQQLRLVGVVEPRIADYLRLWEADRQLKGHHASASEIGRWVRAGTLSEAEAVFRLGQLGYSYQDAQRVLVDNRRTAQLELARVRERQATTAKQRAAAQEKGLKEAAKLRQQNAKRALELGTPAKLVKWLSRGWVTEQEFRRRLTETGHLATDVQRLYLEAMDARQKLESSDGKSGTPGGAEKPAAAGANGNAAR